MMIMERKIMGNIIMKMMKKERKMTGMIMIGKIH